MHEFRNEHLILAVFFNKVFEISKGFFKEIVEHSFRCQRVCLTHHNLIEMGHAFLNQRDYRFMEFQIFMDFLFLNIYLCAVSRHRLTKFILIRIQGYLSK